jgi:4-amino-4-deoxy-L-arabinose transferase-like glycosyltransferase
MSSTTLPPSSTQGGIFATRWLVALWILSGFALGLGVGMPPVQRTQEARVLETARQMRGTGWRGWMVPRINGTLRLRKPPLAYWMSALMYDGAGVSNASGRLPSVIWGWLTIGVTFFAGRHIFGARAGLIAAACLFSSYLFFRHNRLAETDSPSALFATLAIFAWWRAVEVSADESAAPGYRPYLLFHVGAFGTAMAIMFKGGPGAYPPIFLLGFVALRGEWRSLWTFVRSGALLTLIVLAGPWFWYVQRQTRSDQFAGEVDTLFSGQDHGAPFYRYFPELMKAAAPWSLVAIAAFGFALAPLAWHLFPHEGRFRRLLCTMAHDAASGRGLVGCFNLSAVVRHRQQAVTLPASTDATGDVAGGLAARSGDQ